MTEESKDNHDEVELSDKKLMTWLGVSVFMASVFSLFAIGAYFFEGSYSNYELAEEASDPVQESSTYLSIYLLAQSAALFASVVAGVSICRLTAQLLSNQRASAAQHVVGEGLRAGFVLRSVV
jgi:hypothetical protein